MRTVLIMHEVADVGHNSLQVEKAAGTGAQSGMTQVLTFRIIAKARRRYPINSFVSGASRTCYLRAELWTDIIAVATIPLGARGSVLYRREF